MDTKPFPIGVSSGPAIYGETPMPPAELQVSQTTFWSHLVQDEAYELFAPGLLYLSTPLPVDPFAAFAQEQGVELKPLVLQADQPLFQGLMHPNGDLSYCFRLWALPRAESRRFHSWLGQVSYHDPGRQLLWMMRPQSIWVRDAPAFGTLLTAPAVPTVPVTAWAVETSKGSFFYRHPLRDDWLLRWTATYDPAIVYGNTVRFAQALQQDSPNPYGAKEHEPPSQPPSDLPR